MNLEIEQPSHLVKPDLKDPISWALAKPLHCEWLRFVAPQLGFDTEKVILGDTLSTIIGDDFGAFGLDVATDMAEIMKNRIFIRMDWEMEVPELPDDIRSRIRKIRQRMSKMSWEGEENFLIVSNLWVKKVRNFTQHQMALRSDLRDAVAYAREANNVWGPYWTVFLFGYEPF